MKGWPRISSWLLVGILLTAQCLLTQVHLHLGLDPVAQESAIHLATADHTDLTGAHGSGGNEIELQTQDDTRPVNSHDDFAPIALALFVVLLFLLWNPQRFSWWPLPLLRSRTIWRLLPPATAPPAIL